jgi:hypothetical protein
VPLVRRASSIGPGTASGSVSGATTPPEVSARRKPGLLVLNSRTGRSSGSSSKRTVKRARPGGCTPRSPKPFASGCSSGSWKATSRHRKIARFGRLTCTQPSSAGLTSAVYAKLSNGVPSSASAAGSRIGGVPPRGTVKRVIVSAP